MAHDKVWTCKIGFVEDADLPDGADAPLRAAVREAYVRLTGQFPNFIFSGWGGKLTDAEISVLDRQALREHTGL